MNIFSAFLRGDSLRVFCKLNLNKYPNGLALKLGKKSRSRFELSQASKCVRQNFYTGSAGDWGIVYEKFSIDNLNLLLNASCDIE